MGLQGSQVSSWGRGHRSSVALMATAAPVLFYPGKDVRMARAGPVAGELVLSTATASELLLVAFDMSHSTCKATWVVG